MADRYEELARKMYETERQELDLIMPWDSLSAEKQAARVEAVKSNVTLAEPDEIDGLVEQVRERTGDHLVALDSLSDYARVVK